jgi:ferredoxin-type protein NapH
MKFNSFLRSRSAQWLRHLVRLAVLVFIVAVPVLAHYRAFLATNQIEEIRSNDQESLPRSVILGVDRVLRSPHADNGAAQNAQLLARLKNVRGNNWSADLFGVSIVDPLAAAESVAASRRVSAYLLLGLLLPVIATVLLGRFFCSWICPAGLLFDLADKIRSLFERLGIPVRHVTLWRGNKYILLVTGVLLAFLVGIPLLGFFYPPALVGREINAVVTSFFSQLGDNPVRSGAIVLSGASLFLLIIVAAEIFVARRLWCRYLCPGGALYTLLGAPRFARIKNDRPRCTHCTECIKVCPMGLNPMTGSTPGPECDQCLLCLSACPPHSLAIEFSIPRVQNGTAQSPPNPPDQREPHS